MPYTFKLADALPEALKHAKTSYLEKHANNPKVKEFHKKSWEDLLALKAAGKISFDPYNGQLMTASIHEGKQNAPLKMTSNDYLSVRAAGSFKEEMRQHHVAAVVVVIRTSDGQYITGSRDVVKTSPRPAQFPAGMLERQERFATSEEKQEQEKRYKSLSTRKELTEFVIDSAIKEAWEEVYGYLPIANPQLIGAIYETKEWPSKQTGVKTEEVVKSFIVLADTTLTAKQIQERRSPQNTKDMLIEMKELTFIPEAEFLKMTPASKVKLPTNGEQLLVEEQGIAPLVVQAWKQREQQQSQSQGRAV